MNMSESASPNHQLLQASDELAAVEQLHALNCTDGLPVIVPTPERVTRMVLASGYDADLQIGVIGPNMGAATVEKIAIAAVMAGCLPDYMPIVMACIRAVCRPELDTAEWQSTTHAISPLIIINGPAAKECGPFASGFGALGPGHRANMSVGRALRLALINIGGARPGTSDMALLGQPGKLAMVIAENEAESPFPPLHTSLFDSSGATFSNDDSAVTVVGVEGPHSVLSVGDADDPTAPLRLLKSLASAIANVGSNNAHFRRGAVAVAINPDHATALGTAGYTREDIQQQLHELAGNSQSRLHELNPTFNPKSSDEFIRATASPKDILVFHAGGGGLYSTVFPSWGAGPHGNPWVCEPIELNEACDVPIRKG